MKYLPGRAIVRARKFTRTRSPRGVDRNACFLLHLWLSSVTLAFFIVEFLLKISHRLDRFTYHWMLSYIISYCSGCKCPDMSLGQIIFQILLTDFLYPSSKVSPSKILQMSQQKTTCTVWRNTFSFSFLLYYYSFPWEVKLNKHYRLSYLIFHWILINATKSTTILSR